MEMKVIPRLAPTFESSHLCMGIEIVWQWNLRSIVPARRRVPAENGRFLLVKKSMKFIATIQCQCNSL